MSTFFVGGNVLRIYKYILCFVSVLPNQLHFRRRLTVHQSINHHAFNKFSYKTFWPHRCCAFFRSRGIKVVVKRFIPTTMTRAKKLIAEKVSTLKQQQQQQLAKLNSSALYTLTRYPPKKLWFEKKHQRKQWNIHFVKKKEIKRKLAHAHAQRNQMNDETMWKWKCGIIWIDVFIITPEII